MQKPFGLLQSLEVPSKIFKKVSLDLSTHLPKYYRYNTVFTIVDRFSKYVTFLPCTISSTTVDLISYFYDNLVCNFGF